jgi:putative DNA primase/helicase
MISEAEDIARGLGGTKSGDGWKCRCPAHDDTEPSLSVSVGHDGRTLLTCHAGCEFDDITRELEHRGLWSNRGNGHDRTRKANGSSAPKGKLVARYAYKHRDGRHAYYVERCADPKDFRRDPPGAKPNVLYRWPELVAAGPDATLFFCEGEKDADRVRSLEFTATTVANGGWGGVGRFRYRRARRLDPRGRRQGWRQESASCRAGPPRRGEDDPHRALARPRAHRG